LTGSVIEPFSSRGQVQSKAEEAGLNLNQCKPDAALEAVSEQASGPDEPSGPPRKTGPESEFQSRSGERRCCRSRRSLCAFKRFISSSSASIFSVSRAFLDFGASAPRSFSSAFSTESLGVSATTDPHVQATSVQTMAQLRQIGVPATATKSFETSPEPRVRGLLLQIRPPVDLDQHALCRGDLFLRRMSADPRADDCLLNGEADDYRMAGVIAGRQPCIVLHTSLNPTW
jgi:hypothetical protein